MASSKLWYSLKRYWRFYNQARKHQSLEYRTPAEVYFGVKSDRRGTRSRGDDRKTTQPRRRTQTTLTQGFPPGGTLGDETLNQ